MSYSKKFLYSPQPVTVRGQAVRLSTDPKNEKLVYTNGRTVIVRDLDNPEMAWDYTGHSAAATVARFSPSGFYIASGDVNGNVRIWDTINEEHILKLEVKPFSGKINDVAWDSESKRLIAVGEGKDKFGASFMADSGSSVGEILGHSKVINAVSIKNARPFRAITASDDTNVNYYHGVPYKFQCSLNKHSRFVQDARFSPSGDLFITCGSDGKIFLHDGKTGEFVCEVSSGKDSHTGSVFSLAWSMDGKKFVSSSADCTVKLWDAESRQVERTWTFAESPAVEDQQVGNVWSKYIVSLSLGGRFSYFSPSEAQPIRFVSGHQRAITSFTGTRRDSTTSFYSGDYEGRVFAWEDGSAAPLSGNGHTNQVLELYADVNTHVVHSIGMDDTVRQIDADTKKFKDFVHATSTVPRSIASHESLTVTATADLILVSENGNLVSSTPAPYGPTAVALDPARKHVFVGGEDGKCRVYSLESGQILEKAVLQGNKGAITALSMSPDSTMLAAADAGRLVAVYDTEKLALKLHQWCFHSARVNCIAWTPDSLHAASGGLDTNIFVWSVEKPMKNVCIKNAHLDGVNGVFWATNTSLVSAGQDGCIRGWEIEHK